MLGILAGVWTRRVNGNATDTLNQQWGTIVVTVSIILFTILFTMIVCLETPCARSQERATVKSRRTGRSRTTEGSQAKHRLFQGWLLTLGILVGVWQIYPDSGGG